MTEATTKTKAIILRREPYLDNDSRVFVYSQDFGKLNLVVRGTQKLSSKLAAHIEPLNFCEIMIIKGKQYDYLGSCISEDVFSGIKKDYEKSIAAGEVLRIVDNIVKGEEKDEQIFFMLKKFLEVLNNITERRHGASAHILKSAFILKLISLLGYQPKLDESRMGNNKISLKLANFVQMILTMKFEEILNMEIEEKLASELNNAVNKYKQYIFD
ncbi:MAG: DNA repair protein RecO [Patescibacteria group bacterium]|jgi:DNA repair protein RecO (recombination protein O)